MIRAVGVEPRSPVAAPPCDPASWACPGPLPAADFARIRRRLVLDHFKWDPQVGDVPTLARFPLVLQAAVVRGLFELAETLAAETAAAEAELLTRPDLTRRLGLPRAVWRARFTVRPAYPGRRPCDPVRLPPDGGRLVDLRGQLRRARRVRRIVLLPPVDGRTLSRLPAVGDPAAAPGRSDPRPAWRAGPGRPACGPRLPGGPTGCRLPCRRIRRRGWATALGHPGQVTWEGGLARLGGPSRWGRPLLPGRMAGPAAGRDRVAVLLPRRADAGVQPGLAVIGESKRFPVAWDELTTPLPTWRASAPRDPRPAGGPLAARTGLALEGRSPTTATRSMTGRGPGRRPGGERPGRPGCPPAGGRSSARFDPLPVATPDGIMFPCLGVYTVDGRAAGIYGRLSSRPLVDYAAVDVAVLTGYAKVTDVREMTREELFDAWAPAAGIWSDWAKPSSSPPAAPVPAVADMPRRRPLWLPPATERSPSSLICPGRRAFISGSPCPRAGYRPVPCSTPSRRRPRTPRVAVVPVEPILAALAHGADQLRAAALPADAPPAFLLDADRQTARRDLCPGRSTTARSCLPPTSRRPPDWPPTG